MKNILGLDLGTSSIGWAVVSAEEHPIIDASSSTEKVEEVLTGIRMSGSRILPLDEGAIQNFAKGQKSTKTSDRTDKRLIRRQYERARLRRERLLRVLSLMGFLPEHFARTLNRYGAPIEKGDETKLAWRREADGRYQFLFHDSFEEMVADFGRHNPEWVAAGRKIPADWTLYYLRAKALTRPISREELAWVLLSFNQKRGYHQARGEEAEASDKLQKFCSLRILSIERAEKKSKGNKTTFDVTLEGGYHFPYTSIQKPEWEGLTKDFIVTTPLDENGQPKRDKEGNVRYSVRMPAEDDWTLRKLKTEADITRSDETIGQYIYDSLLRHPEQKVRGQLVHTVDRKYYRAEAHRILAAQEAFHPEFRDAELYQQCVAALYPSNEAHRRLLRKPDFVGLLERDILFYQRPLKSKKHLIDNCPFESHSYLNKKTGERHEAPIKCIAKSNPFYEEYRLWQFISHLQVLKRGKVNDEDVTACSLPDFEARAALFSELIDQETIKQDSFLTKYCKFEKGKPEDHRWNFREDYVAPCGATRAAILKALKKAGVSPQQLNALYGQEGATLHPAAVYRLWHLLYSVSEKQELETALRRIAEPLQTETARAAFVKEFAAIKPFDAAYGAYSEKAIKRLLPLMRQGRYWSAEAIDSETRRRIDCILSGEDDEAIDLRTREQFFNRKDGRTFNSIADFQGLPPHLAAYAVYGSSDEERWQSPKDIDRFLEQFKQHSLRNPIVEQVVGETLRVVRDIWQKVGHIDEIRLEVGREMKQTNKQREDAYKRQQRNEGDRLRAKALLAAFANPELGIEGVRPYSPYQLELFRIFEEGAQESVADKEEERQELREILKPFDNLKGKMPSSADVKRYRLWLDQRYTSPYTKQIIPLSRLFTSDYQIEHIIPQARYFDDSFSNKVICESQVNKLKGSMLAHEFIEKHGGESVPLGNGRTVNILTLEQYETLVNDRFAHLPAKRKKLLMDDVPDDFTSRQLNDTRYISRFIMSLLSRIVREEGEQEATSKHLLVLPGAITDRLKQDWGMNDVWNRLILPRFERMNALTGTDHYTAVSAQGHHIPAVPLSEQVGFNKKRIDHRHHAMDAIVIACATRNHINYLHHRSARGEGEKVRQDLQRSVCHKVSNADDQGHYRWVIKAPWPHFAADAQAALESIIVSFRNRQRILSRATNKIETFDKATGKKVLKKQTKGDMLAVRKPLHKETIFGKVNLRRTQTVNLKKALLQSDRIVNHDFRKQLLSLIELGYKEKQIKTYFEDHQDEWSDVNLKAIPIYVFTNETNVSCYATRKALNESFDRKTILSSVTDTGIQKILLAHLDANDDDPNLAFSPEGIATLNRNIKELNGGRPHQPIYKVRWYEESNKFAIGQTGAKATQFVEAQKGTNLFFAIYEEEVVDKKTGEKRKERSFETIPLHLAINRMKQGLPPAPENVKGLAPKLVLSPGDLVYVPTPEELSSGCVCQPISKERIYRMKSANKKQCFFIPYTVARPIVNDKEFLVGNKMEKAVSSEMIKQFCIPIKVNRLGEVIAIGEL